MHQQHQLRLALNVLLAHMQLQQACHHVRNVLLEHLVRMWELLRHLFADVVMLVLIQLQVLQVARFVLRENIPLHA